MEERVFLIFFGFFVFNFFCGFISVVCLFFAGGLCSFPISASSGKEC